MATMMKVTLISEGLMGLPITMMMLLLFTIMILSMMMKETKGCHWTKSLDMERQCAHSTYIDMQDKDTVNDGDDGDGGDDDNGDHAGTMMLF